MRRIAMPIIMLLGLLSPASAQVAFQPQVRSLSCLRPAARQMVAGLTRRIGPIVVTSTCGGRHAHHSMHYRGLAVDFRPLAVAPSRAVATLRGMPGIGGIGAYGNGLIHADVGPRQIAWFGGRRFGGSRRSGTVHFAGLRRSTHRIASYGRFYGAHSRFAHGYRSRVGAHHHRPAYGRYAYQG